MEMSERDNNRASDRLSQFEDSELVRIAKLQLPYVTTAYEVLFHRYHSRLVKVCFRYLSSLEEAEESVNDTMLSVFNSLKSFEQRSSFKTWIYRIAYNQSLNRLRKKRLDLVGIEEADSVAVEEVQTDSFSKNARINQWLTTLSLEDRSIVVFRIAGDLEFSEIAEIVDQKLSTVKMRYKRAIEKMAISAGAEGLDT